ncbi:MAG: adenylate/guanylate cyclase domain-containing protein [Campylobacterota bacterium]|nr:adenylate/guanylate cyclase domain-containing protein [Campylobacterota bacterium]
MNKNLKKFLIYFTSAITVFISLSVFYIYIPKTLESLDNSLRDYLFIIRGEVPNSNNVIVIDIDDKSLNEVGQWPWSRDTVSDMLIQLTNAGIGLIAFDVVFAEEDRTNPVKFIEKYKIDTDKEIPDYDSIFASTVAQTPTVLGYQFQLSKDDFMESRTPEIPAIFIEKNMNELNKDMIVKAYGTILNTPIIQENGYTSGFFNNIPDESGVVRSVPLVIRYDDQIFPSLALETVRIASQATKVFVNYDEIGVTNITVGDLVIPTDRHGRIVVNYRGDRKNFKYISANDILTNNFDPKDVEGAIALIGTSAAGLLDLRATPFNSVYPGVEVHANVIDNILTSDYISKPSWIDGLNIVHILVLSLIVGFLFAYLRLTLAVLFVSILFIADSYLVFNVLFGHGLILNLFFPILAVIVASVVSLTINYFLETRQTKAIKGKFASKVSQEVMESLLENSDDNTFAATTREVTVFFSDVRNFTNISESMPNANVLIEFLNEYMDPMTEIVIDEKGTVDKFIGDAIMAYWNAPGDVPDHPDRAVIATMRQLYKVQELNEIVKTDERFKDTINMCKEKGIPPLDIGIGLNTGEVVVGEMGSNRRSDYTIIGDPVNLGARLESLCKYYNSKCNISDFTKDRLEGNYIYRLLDNVTVKGQSRPVQIWQIIDFDNDGTGEKLYDVTRERLDDEISTYYKALDLYKNSSFKEALDIFKELEERDDKTNKNIYKIYIERCEHYIEEPPEDFDGVFRWTTKG